MAEGFPGTRSSMTICPSSPRRSNIAIALPTLRVVGRTACAHHGEMVFDAPHRDLTLSLYKIRKGLSPTCSQRIEVSRAVLVHETGQWIFEGTTFGTKLHVSAAPSRARWLSVAMQCTLAARHTHYAAFQHVIASFARRTIACR